MRLRVCHVTTGHGLKDDRIFFKEAVSLARWGYDVSIMGQSNLVPDSLMGVRFEPVPIPSFGPRIVRKVVLLSRIRVKSLLMRCHIYHCHELDAAIAVMPNLLLGSRIIYDVHEHFPENYEGRLSRPWLLLLRLLDRFISKLVHLVVAVDEVLADKYKVSKAAAIVHNYPIYSSYTSLDVEKDWNLAIYTGGINEERGILEVVEALRLARERCPGLRLKIVGRFTDEPFRETIERKVEELKLSDAIEIVDWVPFDEMPAVVRQAGIGLSFLRPVRRYTLAVPIKVFEYMAAGLPVVASRFRYVTQIIEAERCGVTAEPESAQSLANALCELLENRKKAKKMGENGRLAVAEKYNWEKESEILLNAYERVIRPVR